ncbi:hypothetical protein QTJ16_006868 [Diplocarpon rosae]|uniref:Uncharacterized protein n=1 Tax=Diplocarpon rosae TaxID=946125 RepID=A0AAD9W9S1_9HELO|nr:hypothetical protein QTJ16_006868 [Diplocarpon rosae]
MKFTLLSATLLLSVLPSLGSATIYAYTVSCAKKIFGGKMDEAGIDATSKNLCKNALKCTGGVDYSSPDATSQFKFICDLCPGDIGYYPISGCLVTSEP